MNDTSADDTIYDIKSLVFVIGMAILAPVVFLVLPVYIGSLYTELGLSESELGLLATSELIAIAIASTSGLYWTSHWNWRAVARVSIAVIILGNILTYMVLSTAPYNTILGIRFVIGLSAGGLTAVVYSYLAAHSDTERAAGFLVAAQTAVQVAAIYLLPVIITASFLGGLFMGAKGIFLVFALFAAVLLAAASYLPVGAAAHEEVAVVEGAQDAKRSPAIIVLISFLLFFAAQTAVWAFLELFGADAGLDGRDTILAITLSTAAAVLGPLFAGVFGNRFGQIKPLVTAGLLQFVGLLMLILLKVDFLILVISLSLFQVGWTMALPYHLGVLTFVDPTHRLIVLTSPASAVGIALGPIYGGVFIEAFGYNALFMAAGVLLVLYLGCIMPFAGNKAD